MRVLLAIVVGLVVTVPAFAQPNRTEPAPVVYEFDNEPVDGTFQTAAGTPIHVRRAGDRHSLIRPRAQLVDKLVTSIESL